MFHLSQQIKGRERIQYIPLYFLYLATLAPVDKAMWAFSK